MLAAQRPDVPGMQLFRRVLRFRRQRVEQALQFAMRARERDAFLEQWAIAVQERLVARFTEPEDQGAYVAGSGGSIARRQFRRRGERLIEVGDLLRESAQPGPLGVI